MFCQLLARITIVPMVLLLLGASIAPVRAQQDGVAAAIPLVSQAKTRIDQRKYDEAAELYQRALTILERDPDKNRQYVIDTLSNLARTHEFQSRYVEAVELRKRAVALGEGSAGRDLRYEGKPALPISSRISPAGVLSRPIPCLP